MVHPKPVTPDHEAFFAWLIGKPWDPAALPETLRDYEAWKVSRQGPVPDVPFQLLTALDLGQSEWSAIAANASWQTTRMNLNTFARHRVFECANLTQRLAARLADPDQIRRAKVFPYQLLVAYLNADKSVPMEIREALQDVMEIATGNVPAITGSIALCPDVSGSMQHPVTGSRPGASSKVRCIDVAALITAALVRKNPAARVLPFEVDVVGVRLNPRDSVMTNATQLAAVGGGGTNCSAPLARLNRDQASPELVIFISDNESWADPKASRGTAMMAEWEKLRRRNPKARLVCIDLVPNTTTQAIEREDILNIGGFSDVVFDLIADFAAGADGSSHWIREIEKQPLNRKMKSA
jgi:60 kDa SS-A/Ro ribonucleoprotein